MKRLAILAAEDVSAEEEWTALLNAFEEADQELEQPAVEHAPGEQVAGVEIDHARRRALPGPEG